ncbi:MAG: trimethylamine methyltransferase family protein [Deltaproteobacteria bacterium]|nr:trimethylamine methyltransferase family protein [Deltaproteobacteria bacterium]
MEIEMKIRPKLQILEESQIKEILADAYHILDTVGVNIRDYPPALDLLEEAGANVDRDRQVVKIGPNLIDKTLSSVPSHIAFYDQDRKEKLFNFGGDNCFICTGGTGIYIQDYENPGHRRKTNTHDQIIHSRLVEECENISFSAPFNLYDVPIEVADNYRFLINYLYSSKPPFASSWSKEGFDTMVEMMAVMASGEENAETRYAHVHPNDPSSPLHWSQVVIQNFMDCMKVGLPPIIICIPIAGGSTPCSLVGTVVLETAENLSGVVIGQLVKQGGPLVWGGGPSAFDFRHGTAPQSAVESILMMCMLAEVGKYLNIPVEGNIGRADSKLPDIQGGLETSMGYTLGCLSGVNMMRGAGILEYASTISFEKLLVDNEIAGQALRIVNGKIDFSDVTRAVEVIREVVEKDGNFLKSKHTMEHFKKEFLLPSEIIDRGTRTAFEDSGYKSAVDRAHEKMKKILSEKDPRVVPEEKRNALIDIVRARAKKYGMEKLPIEEVSE